MTKACKVVQSEQSMVQVSGTRAGNSAGTWPTSWKAAGVHDQSELSGAMRAKYCAGEW